MCSFVWTVSIITHESMKISVGFQVKCPSNLQATTFLFLFSILHRVSKRFLFFLHIILFLSYVSRCFTRLSRLTHLHKEVDHSQWNDDYGEERRGQTDDKKRPQYAQQTQQPGAEGLRNGFIYGKYVLQEQRSYGNV